MFSSVSVALKERRFILRLSQDAVAERAGVTRPTVAMLEGGAGRWSSLAAVLGVLDRSLSGVDRIAAARIERGLSVTEAALKAGLSAPTVRAIEADQRGNLESLEALAGALGVKLRLAAAATGDEWYTPWHIVDALEAAGFRFGLDPCSPSREPGVTEIRAARYLTAEDDGLEADWSGETVYCNPPYGALPAWIAKCSAEAGKGASVVALIPTRPGTGAWRSHILGRADALLLSGRLRFGGPHATGEAARFESSLVMWGWSPEHVARLLAELPEAALLPANPARHAA